MTTNSICINIWDDYYEDGYVPDGKIQETYAYVESFMNDDEEDEDDDNYCEGDDYKNVLDLLKKTIETLAKPEWSLELSLNFYDSAKVYPNLVGTEHEYCLFKRWQLEIKHLTHQAREYLVEELEKQQLNYLGAPIVVYSES